MLFNSFTYFLFLGLVIVVSRWVGNWTVRKGFLLIASYFFYASWDPLFVLLLLFSTVVDWYLAQWIDRLQSPSARRTLLIVSIALNLSYLGYFKYGVFIHDNVMAALQFLGVDVRWATPKITLPIGISFYTFETISYMVDVYRRQTRPWKTAWDYALYLTFFPHLVAGPILRASDFLPQCETPRKATSEQLGWGLCLVVFGLCNKVVIADSMMAPIVDRIFDGAGPFGFWEAWAGTVAFAVQIFCDFAGYSTCAIGSALCLGFVLPVNFRFPYGAIGFSDFWRRWHISLSTWLRDYLYISLGGNRQGPTRTQVNLMLTMLLGGLWHGPSWLFVIWGGLQGLYLVGERLVRQSPLRGLELDKHALGRLFLVAFTFGLICIAWVFFRAQSLDKALLMVGHMLLPRATDLQLPSAEHLGVLVFGALVVGLHYFMRDKELAWVFTRVPLPARALGMGGMMYALLTSMSGVDNAFIYFQF